MRWFIIAAAAAVGLVALWAAILPLTAQPTTKQMPPVISKAQFFCRGHDGLNQDCVGALTAALRLEAKADASTQVSDRSCHADQQVLANLNRRD